MKTDGDATALSSELDGTNVSSNCEALLCLLDSNLDDTDISNSLNADTDADDQGYQLLSDSESLLFSRSLVSSRKNLHLKMKLKKMRLKIVVFLVVAK